MLAAVRFAFGFAAAAPSRRSCGLTAGALCHEQGEGAGATAPGREQRRARSRNFRAR
ncbi:MAG: hypothetical protein Q8L84_11500 [Hyphomonas sp.]|nr:hypothetical protein [Hyphomonas sp.]